MIRYRVDASVLVLILEECSATYCTASLVTVASVAWAAIVHSPLGETPWRGLLASGPHARAGEI